MSDKGRSVRASWPDIPFESWHPTCATLHLLTQIVGKIRMAHAPWTNHSWHVPLYVTSRGLTTSLIPCDGRAFEIEFDLVGHGLQITTTDGRRHALPLTARPIAEQYAEIMAAHAALGLDVELYTTPSEMADATPFEEDTQARAYDGEAVTRFWRALVQVDRVFKEFRARFIGKCSPVHFFWGSFDLAVTRFSGREAPSHPGGVPNFPDWVAREAYSHEVSSAGFWPGGGGVEGAAFYSYAYPAPDAFAKATVRPSQASWSQDLSEFVLPYDDVRMASSPDDALLEFLQSTYEAAADLADWDRAALERDLPLDAMRS